MATLVRKYQRLVGFCGLTALTACVGTRDGVENPDGWFDDGSQIGVEEFVAFTDVNYDIAEGDGIRGLKDAVFPVAAGGAGRDTLVFGADDSSAEAGGCALETNRELPYIVEGIATAHPRFYFKSSGCEWDSDEKYYGSFFIQDETGGQMVLGDTKVAKFDMGDRVRILVRGVKTSFELDMVYSYDLIDIVERAQPIFYEEIDREFRCDLAEPIDWDECDTGRVKRVTGTVVTDKDTFGEFAIESDDGIRWSIGLDVELNRRGINYPIGTRITATGPVLYSFSAYSLVVMRKGQIQVLDE